MAGKQRGGSSEDHAKAGSQSKGGQGKSGGGGGSRSEAASKGGKSHSSEHMAEIGKKGGKK